MKDRVINNHITAIDDGPQALTLDMGQQALSIVGKDSVVQLALACAEWLNEHHYGV